MFDVSIIIPTYNRSDLLEATLQSIAAQDLKGLSVEVVVVDDGSTDNTRQIVEHYKQDILNMKYLYNAHDGYRVALVRNIGIKHSSGQIICFVDSGMILCRDYVWQHEQSHGNSDNTAVIGSIYGYAAQGDSLFGELIDLSKIDKTFASIEARVEYSDVRMESFRYHSYQISDLRAPYTFFWTGNVSVGRKQLLEVGCFDENYTRWGVEDIDLGYRLFLNGTVFSLNLNAKSIHIPHVLAENAKEVLDKERDMRNRLYFHEKYKNIDSELFLTGCQDLFYNRDLNHLFGNTVKRFDFSRINADKIIEEDLDEQAVINGGLGRTSVRFCKKSTLLEFDREKYRLLKENYRSDKVFNSIGTKTFFSVRQFKICLITDFWLYLNDFLLYNLVKESVRIAETVFILYQIKINGEDTIFIKKDSWFKIAHYLKELGKNYMLYEYMENKYIFCYLKIKA